MILQIANILTLPELQDVRDLLAKIPFEDGRKTAGWNARLVKNNEQASASSEAEALRASIAGKLLNNEVFSLAVRPKALTPLLLSRYQPGRSYGTHVDNALMNDLRIDVSFTVFISDPESYEGGDLVIETSAGEQAFKLPAGGVIVYPASTLHRVDPVTKGERLAAVGWARSYIRHTEQRELLFDLERARRSLFDREGKTMEFDLLSKCAANLFRSWAQD